MKNKKTDLEEIIISVLLNNPGFILKYPLELRWFGHFRRVVKGMLDMSAKGLTIDAFSLAEELGEAPGVLSRIVQIQTQVFGAQSNFEHYVKLLREMFEASALHEAIRRADKKITDGESPDAVIAGLIQDSLQTASANAKKFNYTTKEALNLFVDKLDKTLEARDTGGIGLKTGIKALDDTMGGMHPSDLTVVGARPGVGKTALAVSVIRNIAKSGKKVGFFSTEMSVVQVMGRFSSMEANINAHKLRHADLDDSDFARLTAATSVIQSWNLRVCDRPAITIGEISIQSRAWEADGGIDFIVIDYLTRIQSDKPNDNQNLKIGEIVTTLKNIARDLNIPIMVLAQLNRQSTTRKDKRPILADLRDSGIIEQEADQVLMLYRDEEIDSAEIIAEKNRHGGCGIVRCEFEPTTMCWRDNNFTYA